MGAVAVNAREGFGGVDSDINLSPSIRPPRGCGHIAKTALHRGFPTASGAVNRQFAGNAVATGALLERGLWPMTGPLWPLPARVRPRPLLARVRARTDALRHDHDRNRRPQVGSLFIMRR